MTYLEEIAAAIEARVPPDVMPNEDDVDGLFRIYALLARVKGEQVTAEDVHDAWALWMIGQQRVHSRRSGRTATWTRRHDAKIFRSSTRFDL